MWSQGRTLNNEIGASNPFIANGSSKVGTNRAKDLLAEIRIRESPKTCQFLGNAENKIFLKYPVLFATCTSIDMT